MYSIILTSLFAKLTVNAADFTVSPYGFGFVMGVTGHMYLALLGYHYYEIFRTCRQTYAASSTFTSINLSDAILYINSVKFADLYTAISAQATEEAGPCAPSWQLHSGKATAYAFVFIVEGAFTFPTGAADKGTAAY